MFSWKDEYALGVSRIDLQHQRLFQIAGRLQAAMAAGEGSEAAGTVLADLIAYTRMHFAAEEGLMQAYHYPDAAAHKAEHAALLRRVLEYEEAYKAGRVALSVSILHFLKDWLVHHIGARDRRIGEWLKSRNAA